MQGETEDRRSPRARRVELETLVEICGKDPEVPAFEAQSVEVSGRGMQVRTRHLPEVGAPLVLRFERDGNEVLVEGEVAWRSGDDRGGQFGVKFTALDSNSVSALKALCAAGATRAAAGQDAEDADHDVDDADHDVDTDHDDAQQPYLSERGAAVKLHIQGLGAPMKARVFEGTPRKLKVGSQLEFLRVGRELELEDVTAGSRRAAEISTVSVSIDPESQIPQLVVSLRYDGVDDETPEPTVVHQDHDDHIADDEDYDDEFTEDLFKGKVGAVAANAERAMKNTSKQVARWGASALAGLGSVVKSAADRAERTPPKKPGSKSQKPLRRTSRAAAAPATRRRTSTVPAAGGKGRRPAQRSRQPEPTVPKRSSRWVIYGAAAMCCAAGGYALFAERSHQADPFDGQAMNAATQIPGDTTTVGVEPAAGYPAQAGVGPAASSTTAQAAAGSTQAAPLPTGSTGLPARAALDTQQQLQPDPRGIVAQVPLFGPTPMATAEAAPLNPAPVTPTLDEYSMSKDQAFTDRIVTPPAAKSNDDSEPESQEAATVFQVGRMELPHIHRLRLDAPGTALQGSKSPSGFTVLVPGRKVMENGSAIAGRDDRIVNVRVANTPAGSKVTFRFRKDVPGYKARLRNDYVEFFINSPKKK